MQIADSNELMRWYEDKVRGFLASNLGEEKVQAFDKDHARLKRATELSETELAVCFLGNSGVGKSTLINAVIGGDRAVVPSGGVGPLTAQALVVRHNERAGFEVEYHGAGQLLRTVFGLEQMYYAELGRPVSAQDDLEGSDELEEADLVQSEPPPDSENGGDGASEQSRLEKREGLRRRAQLLVTGSQDEERDLKYLLDSLREAAGGKRLWGTIPEERDAERIRAIQYALALAKNKKHHSATASDDSNFSKALHDHATGFLAPLIKSLALNWDTPILRHGITLVDLPGVGVMRDVHRDVTRYWIREKANALVLIVDHRGLHDSVAEALRQSEFLNSLLYSADEPEDDPVVLVAVTRIDDNANERYHQDRSKRKFEHFLDVVQEARDKLRHEMQRSLESIWLTGDDIPSSRRKVVHNLLAKLQVHPLSAPEYARLLAGDEDYLCARGMALYVSSYREREEIAQDAGSINWVENPICEVNDQDRWEGRCTEVNERGEIFGSSALFVHIGREDIDLTEDVPVIGPQDENLFYGRSVPGRRKIAGSGTQSPCKCS